MSKGDGNKDETPIRFYNPRKGGPQPINQPHWKHFSSKISPPTIGMWIFLFVVDIFGSVMIYLSITEINTPDRIMIVLLFGLLMAFVTIPTLSELWRYQKHKINNPDFESRQKAEKKRIKRRKDYR